MDPYASSSTLQATLNTAYASFVVTLASFLPRFLAALLTFMVGILIAQTVRNIIIRTLNRVKLSSAIEKTPFHSFLQQAEVTHTIENIIGSTVYWLIILFIVYVSVSLLGLQTATLVLDRVLLYIPQIFSAVLILVFGTLAAGLAETVVKGAIRSIDGQSARLVGKFTSYLIIVMTVMAAISELGIAQAFITTLFTGFVAAMALAFGLAIGLGSKDTINQMVSEWYNKFKRE